MIGRPMVALSAPRDAAGVVCGKIVPFVSGAPPPRGNVNHAAGMPECAVNEGVPTGREGGVGAAFRG